MARIEIGEIAGAELFSSQDNFMDSMRDLSADELKITGGSGKCKSKKSKSKKSKSKGSCGCGHGC
jgi:hypothetical protein